MVDLSKIKPGDEVLVRGIYVKDTGFDDSACAYVRFSENCQGYLGRAAIAEHHPKALEPGDRVKALGGLDHATVLHIIGESAWVQWSRPAQGDLVPGHQVRPIADLERVDV